MKLTPLDIEQHTFRQVFRGADPEEVRRFLESAAARVEELVRENTELRDGQRRLEQQLAELRAHEAQLREAIVSAGRMGDEIKSAAQKEAEIVRAEAELHAEQIVAEARNDMVRLSEQVRDLRLQKVRLLSELRSVVDAHRRLLDTHETLDREGERRRERSLPPEHRSGEHRVELRSDHRPQPLPEQRRERSSAPPSPPNGRRVGS